MKKLVSLILVAVMAFMCINVSAEAFDITVVPAVAEGTIEVGDQFMVDVKLSDMKPYLTFQLSGSFDCEMAELVAPVYYNRNIGVVQNKFDNETGVFTFVGYDQTRRGIDDEVVCSILFEAKKPGEFTLKFDEETLFGKPNENAFYTVAVSDVKVTITEDTDGNSVDIIKDPEPITPFDDMYGYDWAEKAVGVMYDLGVLTDIADVSYFPGENITRGDFITMLMRVCKQKTSKSVDPFGDVSEDSYQYEAVMTAKALGIAKGDENGNFRPDDFITRQDICALVFRTMLKMNKVDPEIVPEDYISKFADKDEIAPYAVESVAGLIRAKILIGDNTGKIRPNDNMTRAEAAVLLNRLAEFNILISR